MIDVGIKRQLNDGELTQCPIRHTNYTINPCAQHADPLVCKKCWSMPINNKELETQRLY